MSSNESKVVKRSRWSWYFYDFGNSAYASVILLAVFSSYFKNVVVGGAEGTRLWGISVGIAAILVALVSPILGTIADSTKFKKKFLFFFTALSVIFTGLLFFVGEGDVMFGMIIFILAEIGYRGAQVFYDALLSDVSTPENIGAISGKGWAMGMVGGIVALLFVLPIQLLGGPAMTPFAFLLTAVFFLISSIPTFLWVKEKQNGKELKKGEVALFVAFKKLAETFHSIKSYKEFVKYTIAYLIYNDGIMMLMDFAAIIGGTLFGLGQVELIILVVILQVAGAVGALFFGKNADKIGSRSATLYSLIILIITISGIFLIYPLSSGITWFYVIGAFAGFSLSGAQAVSRSMVTQIAPPEKITEFYGFLSVAGRTSTFVGPLVFSTLAFRMNNWYINNHFGDVAEANLTEEMVQTAEKYGVLWGIGSIVAFLIIGSLLLLLVKSASINHKSTSEN
jgi:Permeases of the major facilitator superfamily